MKNVTRVTIVNENGEKFFGEGPYRLLRAVEKEESLLQAAKSMEMSYSKATRIIRNAEQELGFPLLIRRTGGTDGGGSEISPEGREWADRYEEYRKACEEANRALFHTYFETPESGCVIMASGLGTRFGGNKLMTRIGGEPMIRRVIGATDGVFAARTAVTRSSETASYLESQGIDTVLHALPGRNDTVRLGLERIMELADVQGCVFCQSDQPLLRAQTVKRLLFMAASDTQAIWRPEAEGAPGSPVWFPKTLFPELLTLPEGKGGGVLMKRYPEKVKTFRVTDPRELADVDTPEDLRRLFPETIV